MNKKTLENLKIEYKNLTFDHNVNQENFKVKYKTIYKYIKKDYDFLSDKKSNKGNLLTEELIKQIQGLLIGSKTESTKEVLAYIKTNAKNKINLYKAIIKKGEENGND